MTSATMTPLPTFQRIQAKGRRFLRWLTSPHVILAIIMLFLMFYMVIIPLFRMVMTTISYSENDIRYAPGAVPGELTTFHWLRMLTSKIGVVMTYQPMLHSLVVSLGATAMAFLIGGSLAWMVVRTDLPYRHVINILAIVPYIMPSWTIAMAWKVLFNNGTPGGVPGMLMYFTGSAPTGLVGVSARYRSSSAADCITIPSSYLFVSAALMSIDSSLEEAGELAGASRFRILRKITFPLIIPALLSGFIMTFSKVMGTFGGPNVLGVPVRYYTLSTMIRSNITVNAYGDAFVLAIILILFSMTTISLNQRIVGTRKSYETIGGRGFMSQKTKLREWRGVIAGIIIAFQIVVAVGPLILLLWSTFMFRTGDYSLSNFTLAHWIGKGDPKINSGEPGILLNPAIYRGAWNSIRLAVSTAFFTAFLGIILGYAIVKGRGTRLAKITEQLAFIPYVIPGIAFGAVYITMFTKPVGPIPPLYGTFALLVVVSVAKHIPYSSRSGVSAMLQVGRELEEAAAVAGANSWKRFTRIIFPLTSTGFVSGFLVDFHHHHAGAFPDHSFGHPCNPGSGKHDHALQ